MGILDKLRPPTGLRVLVSGGAAGIGATLAAAFDEADCQVHICDISEFALARFQRAYPRVAITQADARSDDDVARVFDVQQGRFGGLDVLINNVGVAGPTGAIERIKPDEWGNTVDVNLNSQYRFVRLGVPLLKSSANAHILCMSSVAGRLGYGLRTPYAATKWAIVGLMKSLAIELGADDIRVNALLPGTVEGPRMENVIRARAIQTGVSYEAMKNSYLEKISLGRMVSADDVAAMALFLCSPGARNISGQAISIDGNLVFL